MKTTSNNNSQVFYLYFHEGRNHYNHNIELTFMGEKTLPEVIEINKQFGSDVEKEQWSDEKDCFVPLPEEEWALYDKAGNCILQGREYLESPTGVLDYDGIYDSDIVTTNYDLNDREKQALLKGYRNSMYDTSNELSEWIEENLLK